MSTYILNRGSLYVEKVIITANSEEEALELARKNEWSDDEEENGISDVIDLDFEKVIEVYPDTVK